MPDDQEKLKANTDQFSAICDHEAELERFYFRKSLRDSGLLERWEKEFRERESIDA